MSKWKCEICGKGFDNFHAEGFDNKIYCPLCFFKRENKKLKETLKGTTHCYDEEEHRMLKEQNKQLKDELIAVNKVLRKALSKRNKWRNRYYNLKQESKKYKEVIDEAIYYLTSTYVTDDPIKFKNDLYDISSKYKGDKQ